MTIRGAPNRSLSDSIKHLTEALNDPVKGNGCAYAMGIAALRVEEEIQRCDSVSAKVKFVNAHPNLLRAGMKFLTMDIPNLSDYVYRCNCGEEEKLETHYILHWLRDLPKGASIDDLQQGKLGGLGQLFLHTAVNIVSNCIVLALSQLTQHKFRSDKSSPLEGSDEMKWPLSADDLFPNGLKHAVQSLECWIIDPDAFLAQRHWEGYVPVDYSVYQLIGQLIAYHEPFGWSVLHPLKTHIVYGGPVIYLEEAVALYKAGNSGAFERVLRMVLDFYDSIDGHDRIQLEDIIERSCRMTGTWWDKLNDIVASAPKWKKLHRRVYRMALLCRSGMNVHFGGMSKSLLRNELAEPKLTVLDRLEDALYAMVRARKAGCLNAGCSPSVSVVHTRLCSGCNLVRYCGEKCQKQAWKAKVHPHKELCPKIRSLREELGEVNWEAVWSPDFTFEDFRNLVRTQALDVALVREAGTAISEINAQKDERRKVYIEDKRKNDPAYSRAERTMRAENWGRFMDSPWPEMFRRGEVDVTFSML